MVRHMRNLAAGLAVCCAVSCAPDSSQQSRPGDVEATILVVKKTPNDALSFGGTAPQYVEDYLASQLVLLKSPHILSRALQRANLQALSFAKDMNREQMIYAVRDRLTVQRHADAKDNVIVVTFNAPDSKEGIEILRAIVEAYQSFLDETYKSASDRTLELILDAKRTLSEKLESSEQQYVEFRLKNPRVGSEPEQTKLKLERLSAVEARRIMLATARADLEGRLAWAEKAITEKSGSLPLMLKANEWAARIGFDKLPKEARNGMDAGQAYIAFLKQEIVENRLIEKGLDQLFEAEGTRAKEQMEYQLQDDRLRNRIAQTRQLLESITKRLSEISLVKDFGGYEARLVSPPHVKK
jgi:polysaccharide biosynthesis transport protein